jgi:3-deoxy-D-manno-octulosonate 8-phosphate phosphatase (KDO 8-P phosphatase)
MTDFGLNVLPPTAVRAIRELRFVAFDFDGVFTDNTVYVSQDGTEMVRCSRSDGFGLRRIEALGLITLIISTEKNPVVAARSAKLQIRCIHGCDDKARVLLQVLSERCIQPTQAAYVGNDINDLECLRLVGFPVAVADAYPEVKAIAAYETRRQGGYGAVREICDLIATIKAAPAALEAVR